MDTADAIALALAGLAVLIGASIAAVVVLRPPTRRDHPPSTLPGSVPGHDAIDDATGSDPATGEDTPSGNGDSRPPPTTDTSPPASTPATPATRSAPATTATSDTDSPTTAPAVVSDTPTSPSRPSSRLSDPTPPTSPRISTDAAGGPRAEREEGVSVAIRVDEDGNHRWRVSLSPTGDPITVDVFSFRAVGSNGDQPWQHELLVSPMQLEPGQAKSIGGPVDPTVEYTVSIAWIAHHPDGDTDTTRLLHIPVSEIRTWGLNSATARARRRPE